MNKKNLLIVLGVMALIGGSATAWKFLHKPSVEEVALANKKMFTQIEDETSETSIDDLTNELKLGKESFSLEDVSVEDISKYSGLSINEEYTEDDEIVYFGDDLGIAVYTEDGVVNGITVDVGEYNDFNFYGVTAQSSYEDLVEILGKENSSYSDDDFSAYTWEIGNMNINVSYDGKDMYSVEIIKY